MKPETLRFYMIGRFTYAFAPHDGDWVADQRRGHVSLTARGQNGHILINIWPNSRTWSVWDTASTGKKGVKAITCMPPNLISSAYTHTETPRGTYKGRGWYDQLVDDVVAAAKPLVRNYDVTDTGTALKFERRDDG